MQPPTGGWGPPCPVCGRPSGDTGTGPCPRCGLPAVAQAAMVVARIGVTLVELNRDRDALLAGLRAAAPGPPPPPATPAPTPWMPVPPAPAPWTPPPAPPVVPLPPRRRLSPQQVLLSLGALLVVAAAITFVAVAWTQLGVVFQSVVLLVVTALLCTASAWTARRGLRATEEALAAAGAALIAVDLAAARWLGLFRLEEVSLRLWWAVSCAVLVAVGFLLGRLTRTTATWPLVALLAAQPLPFLLLTGELFTGPVGVAVALAVAGADVFIARRIRPVLAPVAWVLAGTFAAGGVVGGLAVAAGDDGLESWSATGVLAVAGGVVLLLGNRMHDRHGTPPRFPEVVPGGVGLVVGTALPLSLRTLGDTGLLAAAAIGIVLLVGAVLTTGRTGVTALLAAAGGAATLVPAGLLAEDRRPGEFALVALGLTVPAVLAAVRLPVLRSQATGTALLAPLVAVLSAYGDDVVSAPVAGLLLAVLGAVGFAVATLRAGGPEEWVSAAGAALAGATAGLVTGTVGAWGQVAIQLAVVGVAAGCYAVVAGRRPVAVLAVTDLVIASWIAVAGAGVETPEAYTLPGAVGLLLIALPQLRGGVPSWAAEGAAVGVALVPSALAVVTEPTPLRLVLVVAAATTATVAGTLLHRQAPFVLGVGTLLLVLVGRLAPYTPLLPWWVTLGIPGLLLFVVGATYERRLQQAREAVAWVAQMR